MPYVKCLSVHSTPARTLAYIVNPDKTENLLYVSGLNCSVNPVSAYTDMKFIYENFAEISFDENEVENKKTPVKLFHFIQSFAPKENITPEIAHDIAEEWAKKAFGENRQIIISTHVDKEHIHNHIIINPYDLNGVKYNSNKKTLEAVRNLSDKISLKYGIEPIKKGKNKGTSYKEWEEKKKGTSWKRNLKIEIDKLVYHSENLAELLTQLKDKKYEIKMGKYIAVKAPEQKRFIRLKTLGEGYDEESLNQRIAIAVQEKSIENEQKNTENNEIEIVYFKTIKDVSELIRNEQKVIKKFDNKLPYSINNDYTVKQLALQLQIIKRDGITSINAVDNDIIKLKNE